MKKLIGSREFYRTVAALALPLLLQNAVSTFVNLLDNLMVGRIGTESMSGVSIVNQLLFVFNLCLFGGTGGAGIFGAQFYGRGDHKGLRHSLRFNIVLAMSFTVLGVGALTLFQDFFIRAFLHDTGSAGDLALTLSEGKKYLHIMLLGLPGFALTTAYVGILRVTGDTKLPMRASITAIGVNLVFNWLLIFGHLGFPQMGVKGAAAATVLSRYVEFFIIAVYAYVKRRRFPYMQGLFKGFSVPLDVLGSVFRKGLPLLVNEILWSAGMSTLSVAYSLHGLSVVAAASISSTVTNLFYIAFLSLGVSIGIISGRLLGAGRHEEAVDAVRKLIAFSVFVSVVMAVVLFAFGGEIPKLYKTSEESKALAAYFIRVCACISPLVAFSNASYFTLRSGGKTLVTSLFDCGTLWVFYVPVAFGLYYLFHLPIRVVFPIVQAIELIKVVVGFILVKKKVWVRTII